jgi:hypothetical protein
MRLPRAPAQAMELNLQSQAGTCGVRPCPAFTTPARADFQIDWVAAYAYRPRSAR